MMTSATTPRTRRGWLVTACVVPITVAIMCGATGPASAAPSHPAMDTPPSGPVVTPAPHTPKELSRALPLVNATAAYPITSTAHSTAQHLVPAARPIPLNSDTVRYGTVQTPRPNWLPRPAADQINSGAAQLKTQIDAGWNQLGVPPQQRVAVGAAAAGTYGALIGGIGAAVPSAVAGALGGAVAGAIIGGCIGGAPTGGAGMPAGALIGGIIGAGIGAVGAGTAGGLAGAAAVGTEAGLAGAAAGALGS